MSRLFIQVSKLIDVGKLHIRDLTEKVYCGHVNDFNRVTVVNDDETPKTCVHKLQEILYTLETVETWTLVSTIYNLNKNNQMDLIITTILK